MEIDERTLERIKEAVDWLSSPVRISIDEEGEIHVALSVKIGDFAHYRERHTSEPEDRPVAEFVSNLVPRATYVSIIFKKPNVLLTRLKLSIGMTA